nr:hypothetical protein [uncultured Butyrivibrio sp.]
MIAEVHHISILIRSEETIEFYKILGFREILRKSRDNDIVVILEGYGIQLEVFIDDRHPTRVTDVTEPLGPRHFAFRVDGSLEKEICRLREVFMEKLQFDPQFGDIGKDWIGEQYVFFKDPDGNVLELHE